MTKKRTPTLKPVFLTIKIKCREKPLTLKKRTYKLNSHDMTPNSEIKHGMHE